jgi:beta-glucuronidase
VLWYQRYFSYQKRAHTRTFLYFGAANYQARVWLNGVELGEHQGGFTLFDFEVTDKISEGENSVVVEVDSTRRADGVPGLHTDWWNYGGLTHSVQLIEVPQTFVQNYAVHLAKDGGRIEGWVQVNAHQATGTVLFEYLIDRSPATVEIPEIHLKQVAPVDSAGHAVFSFPAKLELWSLENPKLYHVIISGQGDRVSDDIGFRSIEVRGTQILLNGKPIFLRGICLHEEAPFRRGRAFSEADDATLLGWAKELGANFVRLAHYPHNEEMIRLADRVGLLVWEEAPAYWDIDWKNPATLENAKAQLRDVIARDQNRAAVALWSMSNETPISPERTVFLKALADYARQLDSTRLIMSALNRTEHAGDVRTLNDPLAESLDVIGVNEYIGWYEGKPEDADRAQWKFAQEKPVIISEFGADAQYGLHGDAATRFTEEYQANLFQRQLAMAQRIPELAGLSPWVLMDFRSPRRFLPVIQDFYNRKGFGFRPGEEEAGVLCVAEVLSGKATAVGALI